MRTASEGILNFPAIAMIHRHVNLLVQAIVQPLGSLVYSAILEFAAAAPRLGRSG